MTNKEALSEARRNLLKKEREQHKLERDINRKGSGHGHIIIGRKRKKKAASPIDVLIAAAGRSAGSSGAGSQEVNQP